MTKKKLVLLVALVALPLSVSAHEVKRAGTLDILLHMEPLDNPAAGEDAQLYFSVDDSSDRFEYDDCQCRVTVKSFDGRELLNRLVTPDDYAPDWGLDVARISFVFPQIGLYKVSLIGTSKNGTFTPINLEYDKRIERQSETDSLNKSPEPEESKWYEDYYLIGGVLIMFVIITYELVTRNRKKK